MKVDIFIKWAELKSCDQRSKLDHLFVKVWLSAGLSMSNLASPNEGAKLVLASSNNSNHPAEAIIDGYIHYESHTSCFI